MASLLWLIFWLVGVGALAYHRVSLQISTGILGAGLVITTLFSPFSWITLLLGWLLIGSALTLFNHPKWRRQYFLEPLFEKLKKIQPEISEVEKVALQSGTVSWDGDLFSGRPNWKKLLNYPAPQLSAEEQAFIEGPVKELLTMTNDWEITHYDLALSPTIWTFLKEHGFLGLKIPKRYGGKGFSELAHSEIITHLAERSVTLAASVSVPNSLGPAELILKYGLDTQKDHYLPRLATGEEIPCFALTAPEAGSDAGSITDTGVISKGTFEGKEVIGITLNWDKRYITLAPIATLLGLAFKLYDPEHLLGQKEYRGITLALVPTHLPGITIGRRHFPMNIPFQNGPTQGKDVFIPIDWIIGGPKMAGEGWRMLMECLSTGRAISLPALSGGSAKTSALFTTAYARIRRQFRIPLAKFEGIQEGLARIAGFTYLFESIRVFTANLIDQGEKPAVLSAMSKYQVTELGRKVANDAMD
ncbi:MAG TPA: acyl-CoA dehydrogenase, partial [Gammaproteobacteria bacterium]|nr:acyl-CoA dehydrogenase [Gammaproteobacteria bacterium]